MPKARNNYFMGCAMVAYVRDDAPRQRHMNFVTQIPDKKISAGVIDHARKALISRIVLEGGIPQEDIRDVVFLTWSHLGFMTEDEFQDIEDEPKETKKSASPYDA